MNQYRPIRQADYPVVARIVRDASVEPAKRFGIRRDDCPVHPSLYHLESLRREIAGGRRFFVLENAGEIRACIALREDEPGTIELSRLAVDPIHQRTGAGAQLLEHAMVEARSRGARRAKMFLFARNHELVAWLQRRGFGLTDTLAVNDVPTPLSTMVRPIDGPMPLEMRLLKRGDEWMLEPFLLERLDSSAMLLSNLRKGGIIDEGKPRQATYLAAMDGSKVVGVVSLTRAGTLLPQAPVMLDALVRTMAAIGPREIEGVIGLADQVMRTTQVLSLPLGRHEVVLMDSQEHLYGLTLAEMQLPPQLEQGHFKCRKVEARDVPLLTDWMMAFNMESMNRRLPRQEVEANLLENAEEHDNRWVLEVDGQIVATTGFNATAAEIVQVGGVYTPPELRRRHYARSAVAGSLLEAKANGVGRGVLFTAIENTPAQRAYEALGFKRLGEFRIVLYKRPVTPTLIVPAF